MKEILLPGNSDRRLVFYLAMEEYVASRVAGGCPGYEDGAFFTWQVGPTVIFGRNQDMEAEVNVPYCRSHGIAMYRRKSGGGCVYADRGNVMISHVTAGSDVVGSFSTYLAKMVSALSGLGIDAVSSEHNDVLAGGGKVSGNALFAAPRTTTVHGTLMLDVDFDVLQQAITPSVSKLESHGVKSVRQRVRNLRELGLVQDAAEVRRWLAGCFCSGEPVSLDESDIAAISLIEKEYLDPSFILGKNQ